MEPTEPEEWLEIEVRMPGASPSWENAGGAGGATDDAGAVADDDAGGEGGRRPGREGQGPGVPERRRLARLLLELGGSAVEEGEGWLRTHVPVPAEVVPPFLRRARRRIEDVVPGAELRWSREADRDWGEEWRRSLEPRRVGETLVVAPPGSDVEPGPGTRVLRIEPGMAFGTAEHGSTRGCLRLLERCLEPGDRVLDVGAGSGILTVAAVRLGAGRVVALEVDEEAVRTARDNLEQNEAGGPVSLLRVEATPAVLSLLAPPPFDVAVANLLLPPLLRFLEGFERAVAEGGVLVAGGVAAEERDRFVEEASGRGWRVEAQVEDEGWWSGALRLTRRAEDPPPG